MSVIDDISTASLQMLEEVNPASPVFWSLPEIRGIVLEAMCEASLITGEPEVREGVPITIVHGQTLQTMPPGAFAILRMELGGLQLRRVSVFDLDMDNNQWQNDLPANVPNDWFPLGLTQWGVHPQLIADVQAIVTVVQFPVTTAPPFTGQEPVPFQSEFNLGLEEYVSCWSRLKEGSAELDAGMSGYELFLDIMAEMSNFALRKGSLRFSKVAGGVSEVNPVQKK